MNWPIRINPRAQRWLWRALFALAGLYLLYLVAGNLFLNTAIGPSTLNRKPEKFQMHWSGGSTWWPGHVALSDVKLQGHVRHTQWSIHAAKVKGRIAFLPLFGKELRVPEAWASEVTGAVRKVEKELSPPAPRAGGWTLRFDRIASDSVRGGQLGTFQLQGNGVAELGFVKQLRGGAMEVLTSHVKFTALRLSDARKEWIRDGVLRAEFAMARHTRAQASGIQKLRLADAKVSLQGTTAALDVATGSDGKVVVSSVPGAGKVEADFGFVRGLMKPGSQLRWQMPVTSTDAKGVTHRDDLQALFAVDKDLHLKILAPPQAAGVVGLDVDLLARGNQVPLQDFASLLPRTSGHVSGQWRFASLRWLGQLFTQAHWLALDGAGSVTADVKVVDGKVAAGSKFSVPEVAVVADVMGNRIRGLARAEGKFSANPKGELLPALNIVMENFDIAADDNPRMPYVKGRDLRLDLSAGQDLTALRESLRAHLTFNNASLPDLRVYNRYLPNQHLHFQGGSALVSGDLHLDAAGDIGTGWIRVAGRKAQMRMAGLELRGDIDINTQLRRADLARHNFAVDGSTIKLDNINFSEPGGESRSGWWARIKLQRARMDWNKPLAVTGSVDATLKDVGFLLSLFSRQREYPKWVYKLVDAGQAKVQGRVQWQRDTLLLDRISASNDRFELLARMQLHGQNRYGSLFAKWGPLSVGVQKNAQGSKFHLVRARQWYDSQASF